MFLFIVGPATMLTLATVDEFKVFSEKYNLEDVHILPPDENIRDWPVIGNNVYNQWAEASVNIADFL